MTNRTQRERRIGGMSVRQRHMAVRRLNGHIARWSGLVVLQGERVREAQDLERAANEMWLFAMALRGLLQAAQALDDLDVAVTEAVARFDGAAPDAKDVRDVLVHFDDYEMGIGRLQPKATGETAEDWHPMVVTHARSSTESMLWINYPRLKLEVQVALEAAGRLAEDLLDITHRELDRTRFGPGGGHGVWTAAP